MLLNVFSEVMFPLILLSGLGAVVGRRARLPVSSLSSLVFNLFIPALIFDTLVRVDVDVDLVLPIVGVVIFVSIGSGLLGIGYALIRGLSRSHVAAVALCSAVANLGNMGLPVSRLAFGTNGLAIAVVAFITGSVLSNTVGIVLASLSGGRLRDALISPLKVPALWAVPPALVVRGRDLAPWLSESLGMLSDAAVPLMLVVLGLQATSQRPTRSNFSEALGPVSLRLLAGPLLALAATSTLGLIGTTQQTLVVLGGMPAGVVVTIIATRYNAQPDLAARTVMISTVASFFTLTLLITSLR